jgi:hypothetical protein
MDVKREMKRTNYRKSKHATEKASTPMIVCHSIRRTRLELKMRSQLKDCISLFVKDRAGFGIYRELRELSNAK